MTSNLQTRLFVAALCFVACDARPKKIDAVKAGPSVPEVLKGTPAGTALYCDTAMVTASLLDGGDVVVAHGSDFHDLVRVEDGKALVRTRDPVRGGSFWGTVCPRNGPCQAVSLSDGSTVDMPDDSKILRVVEDGPAKFWFVLMSETDGKKAWSYGTFANGQLSHFPIPDDPQTPVLQHDALWTQTDECVLQRLAADGTVKCVHAGPPEFRTQVFALGPDHVGYFNAGYGGDFKPATVFATTTGKPVDVGCGEQPTAMRAYVADPPAVLVRCGATVRFWTPTRGSAAGEDTDQQKRHWPNQHARFLPVGPNSYLDAVEDELVGSEFPLEGLSKGGYGLAEGRVIDWSGKRSRPFDFPECNFMDGGPDEDFEHWRLSRCASEVSNDERGRLRKRPPTIDSCTSPARPDRLITWQKLVDLRDGSVHPLVGLKVAGLTRHGIVGVRGSGHDLLLDSADGVQIVLQPYPQLSATKRTDWEPLPAVEVKVPTEGEAPKDPNAYQNAVFEWTCLFKSGLPFDTKTQILEKIYARYDLTSADFGGMEQTKRLNPRMKMEIFKRAEACTDEDALGFGDD